MYVSEASAYVDRETTIRGWLYNKRSSGKIQFLLVRDGTGIIQAVVFKPEVPAEVFQRGEELTQESSLVVTGTVRKDDRAPGGYELLVKDLQIVQIAQDYPIAPKEHGVGFLMEHRHLWLRSSRQHAVLRVRAQVIKACRDYLDQQGFLLVDAPILTPAACEGTSTLFETDYFGEKAYLSQSGQLYNEAAAMAFGKVYCFGPTFRAEKSKTRRHLTEFWMIEPEAAYYTFEDLIQLEESFVSYIVQSVVAQCREELATLERDTAPLANVHPPFPRITYDQALDILHQHGKEINWGDDFGGDEETLLAEQFPKPVFITHYPARCKAFYMQPDPDRPQ
ncbi:MAG: asparagine--tRNA ligase, partial [Chloroflexi bacterium]|nr:asparagine--tRNA ligase [Chloroflexota bacterium]